NDELSGDRRGEGDPRLLVAAGANLDPLYTSLAGSRDQGRKQHVTDAATTAIGGDDHRQLRARALGGTDPPPQPDDAVLPISRGLGHRQRDPLEAFGAREIAWDRSRRTGALSTGDRHVHEQIDRFVIPHRTELETTGSHRTTAQPRRVGTRSEKERF